MIKYDRLRDIREDNDFSQAQLAEILGVKRSTYSLWELGINIIPLDKLIQFADCFNYSVDYVLGLSNNRKTKIIKKGLDIKKLGKNMKELRIKKGLSQENVATMLGVSQVCILKYEKGSIYISTSNLYKFCKEFDVSLNKICGKEI